MKYFGYLVLTDGSPIGNSFVLNNRNAVKVLFLEASERDMQAQQAALKAPGVSILCFETNKTIEVHANDIKFRNKKITDRGEVIPE